MRSCARELAANRVLKSKLSHDTHGLRIVGVGFQDQRQGTVQCTVTLLGLGVQGIQYRQRLCRYAPIAEFHKDMHYNANFLQVLMVTQEYT